MKSVAIASLLLTASATLCVPVLHAEELENWFEDPFFMISSDLAACPVPLGPYITEAQRNAQSHGRAERGTSCYEAGLCSRPNSYLYDRDIAQALRHRLAGASGLPGSTLWVTVQRRFITVEGCISASGSIPEIESFMRELPDVERVIVNVRVGSGTTAPYRTRESSKP